MCPVKSKERNLSRQRPVSCHFCRSRKLRCSRQFPCPNCTSRGISCQLYASLPVLPVSSTRNDFEVSQSEISARLQRLEEIVQRISGHESPLTPEDQRPTQTRSYASPREQPEATDAEWLERESMQQSPLDSILSDSLTFKICPIQQITRSASYIFQNATSLSSLGEPTKCIWLPLHDESRQLLEKYLNDITYVHHVVHIPSMRVLLREIYSDLDRQTDVKPGQAALLLSIIASSTFSWTARDTNALFSTAEKANDQSTLWIKATMDVLDYTRRMSLGTLEAIQAMIILSFVVCNLEGISPRYRSLASTAILLARELGLHRIDQPYSTTLSNMPDPSSVQAEIWRRVWWYLAATDWILSRYSGPHEGLYTINPRHMAVNKPKNLNDEDLADGMPNIQKPLSHPTSMSYFLQRIRLAELCRGFSDSNPLVLSGPETMTPSQLMNVETQISQLVNEIPAFFRLNGGSLDEIAETDARRAPGIIIQRYILNSLVHAQRCKLHLPYLARSAVDPSYLPSREICLDAARHVIQTERLLEKEDLPFVLTRLKFAGVLHCVFMATIVLLLDICFNNDGRNEQARKAEVVDACTILEEATEQSTMATKLLESLMSVLRKHQVSLPGFEGPRTFATRIPACEDATTATLEAAESTDSRSPSQGLSYFDEIWQSFDGGMDLDTLDWNGLFSELDSQFL